MSEGSAEIKFNFSNWSPEAPAGLQFMSLVPLGSDISTGYAVSQDYEQSEHTGKIKASKEHRKLRRKQFASGEPVCGLLKDERRLHIAAGKDDITTVSDLLDDGVDPCCADDKKRTALHMAAAKGNVAIVQLLLSRGADPNQKDLLENTPLHLAACTPRLPVITTLLKAGADVNAVDHSKRTPLHLARAKLRMIQKDSSLSSQQLKLKVSEVIEVMKEYLTATGTISGVMRLDQLCTRLQNTSTREDIAVVNDILTEFSNLGIDDHT